jgi:hypothetical protein
MYFKLPENYFKNLNKQQLLDKLTSELKNFTATEKFKNSFFAKAKAIAFESTGQTIWSR